MKRLKQLSILWTIGIILMVGLHIKGIVQVCIMDSHINQEEIEPTKGMINRQKWEEKGIIAYLEDVYGVSMATGIMEKLEEECGEEMPEMLYGEEIGSIKWYPFISDAVKVSGKISDIIEIIDEPKEPWFYKWLLGDY